MEEIKTILPILQDISWPAGMIVSLWIVFRSPFTKVLADLLKSKIPSNVMKSEHEEKLSSIDNRVTEFANHSFHEMLEQLKDIKDSGLRQERMMEKMSDNIIFIKSRLNGKSN